MKEKKPLKRVIELQTLSHDHHHGLQLCWKIRTGISKNIAPERIKAYTDWFFENHLVPHFSLEEKDVFTILNANNKLVVRAIAEHRSLEALFKSKINLLATLQLIESQLKSHIRFEERELFTVIQEIASETQLAKIKAAHNDEGFVEYEDDVFWK